MSCEHEIMSDGTQIGMPLWHGPGSCNLHLNKAISSHMADTYVIEKPEKSAAVRID